MRNLLLTGGIRHDFDANTRAVVELLAEIGVNSEITEDLDAGLRRLGSESFDFVTVMALRWRMLGNPKYDASRAEFGYSMAPDCREMLRDFVGRGGGLFGLHTACICFDDWDEWRDLLGGSWAWGRSFHPPLGEVRVSPTQSHHDLTGGLGGFELVDEVYSGLDLAADVVPLLEARAEDGTVSPVLWARQYGKGRVAFDALGHDRRSLDHEVHRRLIQRCAAWVGGSPGEQLGAI